MAQGVNSSGLFKMMIKALHKRAEKRNQRPHRPGVFYPSDLALCTRRVYYAFIGTPATRDEPPRGVFTLWHGQKIHEMIQDLFTDMYGDKFESEVVCKTDHPISGRCDGVVTLGAKHTGGPRAGKSIRFGLEIKSASQKNYRRNIAQAKTNDVVQAAIYAACLDLDFMHIIYYNKNDEDIPAGDTGEKVQFMEHMIPADPALWRSLERKMTTVKIAAKHKEPPPQEPSYLCDWCPYFTTCKPIRTK